MHYPVLIGDIGGTNARFAMVSDAFSPPRPFASVKLAEFATLEEAMQAVVFDQVSHWPKSMVLALATPLVGETFRLTNGGWTIDPSALLARFGLSRLQLMNDFTAQGLAALSLGTESLGMLGGEAPADMQPKIVLGPGTGLGVATLVPHGGNWIIVPGEGGHVDLGPRTQEEFEIWRHLPRAGGRVSAEEAVSGRGLISLYRAICRTHGKTPDEADSATIADMARRETDSAARQAVELFIGLLGRVAGDMALVTMARGGVYIAGGIASKLLPLVDGSVLRREFDNKEPYGEVMREIPIYVMQHPNPGLEGLSAYIRQPGRFHIAGPDKRYGDTR